MKIVCVADMHGHLPDIPQCDLLLIGGDFVNSMDHHNDDNFFLMDIMTRAWLETVSAKHVVSVAGNHDFLYQGGKIPKDLPWNYLQDSGIDIEGRKIWGTPWQPVFGNWAFNANEKEQAKHFAGIPDDTEILLCHSPPFGYGDLTTSGLHVGSKPLLEKIKTLSKLKLLVCGHIHDAYGVYSLVKDNGEKVDIINAALVDHHYNLSQAPVVFHLQ